MSRRVRRTRRIVPEHFDFQALPVSPTWLQALERNEVETQTLFELLQQTGVYESCRLGRTRGLRRASFARILQAHLQMSPLAPPKVRNLYGRSVASGR